MRMIPPSDVTAQSDFLEAKGRSRGTGGLVNESFKLGPYQVTNVRRSVHSIDKMDGLLLVGLGPARTEIENNYSFRLKDGGATLKARCEVSTLRKSQSLWSSASQQTRVNCTCGAGAQAVGLEMEMERRKLLRAGRLSLAGRTLDLTAVYETNARWAVEPGGFRVDEGGQPIGAVEILHPGGIWLSRSLDEAERRQIGCLLSAVMLYVEPREERE